MGGTSPRTLDNRCVDDDALVTARAEVDRAPTGGAAWGDAVARLLAVLDGVDPPSPDVASTLLDEAIALARRYLDLRSADGDRRQRATVEIGLGVDLSNRYQRSGRADDLDEAVRLGRARVAAGDPATWVTDHVNLAGRLLRCYDDRDVVALLDEVVDLLEPAVARRDVDELGRASLAVNLAAAYSHRYDLSHDISALRRSVELYTLAVRDGDPDEVPAIRAPLAEVLLDLHRSGAEPDALDRAREQARAATQAAGGDVARASRWLTTTHVALAAHDAGRPGALAEAGDAIGHALTALPAGAPARATYLSTAATVDFERYLATGDRGALDASIETATTGLALPHDDPAARVALANQACLARTERFEVVGNRDDLYGAIELARVALRGSTRTDAELPLRTNLANALQRAFELDGERALLVEGLAVIAPAVRRTPAGTGRAGRLNTAALLRSSLARVTGSADELDRAVELAREALALTDPATPEYAIYATNAAGWLADRSSAGGGRADLDAAIALLEGPYAGLDAESALEPRAAYTLGCLFADRHDRFTGAEGPADLQRACDLWDAALAAGEPFVGVFAGQRLGDVAFAYAMWDKCEKAMALALDAARRLTARREHTRDRERARLEVQGIAATAAVAAVRDGRPEAAVVHLEQGAATLLAEAAGFPADHATLPDVVSASRALGMLLVFVATTAAGGVALSVAPDGAIGSVGLAMNGDDAERILDDLRTGFTEDGPDPLARWDAAAQAAVAATSAQLLDPLRGLIGDAADVGIVALGRPAWLPLAAAIDADPDLRCVPRQLPNARTLTAPTP